MPAYSFDRMSKSAVIARFFDPFDQSVNPNRHSGEQHSRRSTRVSMDVKSQGALSFYNINYVVDGSRNRCRLPFRKAKSGKQVIDNVSGIFTTGMNAVMGESVYSEDIFG